MLLLDVNVLIYAFRTESPYHAICKPWLDRLTFGSSRFGLSPLALSGLVRITTNPRFYDDPSSPQEAFAFADNLLGQPGCQVVEPGIRHWTMFRDLCLGTGTVGGRVTDAWFAALAIEWDCEWITMDRDFARFPGLRWRAPA